MTLIIVMTGCIAFVMGWVISKVVNAPKFYESGRLGVYHSREGYKLIRLVQTAYLDQPFIYVESATYTTNCSIPYFIKAEKLTMYTIDGEVINEANWNN